MRSDYALYLVAVIFLAITVTVLALLPEGNERTLSAVATVVLCLLSAGVGYTLRPRTRITTTTIEAPPPPQPLATTPPPIVEPIKPQEAGVKTELVTKTAELIAVKGVKEKRAEQLKALGIMNANDLANASAKDLAAKLKIPQYFPEQWIKNAKELLEKS